MEPFRKQLALVQFVGPRFADHGLDVDVLPELVAYKRLLEETAKEIWRGANPSRRRLPKNFDTDVSLKFFELRAGSTGVPLVYELPHGRAPLLFGNELEEASDLVGWAISRANLGEGAPKEFPRRLIPLFQSFGDTLRDDEAMLLSSPNTPKPSRYDKVIKERILQWATTHYLDQVNLVGEVRGTDLDGRRFALRLSNGRKVPGCFEPQHEAMVLEALGDHSSRKLRVIGIGKFTAEDGDLQEISSVERVELLGFEEPQGAVNVWERLASIGASVPDEVWKEVPSDLSADVDSYLYGRKTSH
jgi:hypothetical protein